MSQGYTELTLFLRDPTIWKDGILPDEFHDIDKWKEEIENDM